MEQRSTAVTPDPQALLPAAVCQSLSGDMTKVTSVTQSIVLHLYSKEGSRDPKITPKPHTAVNGTV